MSARAAIVLGLALAWGCGAATGDAEQGAAPTAPADAGAASPFARPEAQPVVATLITEHASIQPGGTTRVGIYFEIEPGWHIYAQHPGDAGMPTTIEWAEFAGATFGPIEWPPHEEFLDPGNIRTFGYSGHTVLAQTLTLITRETPDTVPLQATVKWLACHDICIPGSAELQVTLPVSAQPPVLSAHSELFDHTHHSGG
jgi:thiol:disulfide interchange protein DsbD